MEGESLYSVGHIASPTSHGTLLRMRVAALENFDFCTCPTVVRAVRLRLCTRFKLIPSLRLAHISVGFALKQSGQS